MSGIHNQADRPSWRAPSIGMECSRFRYVSTLDFSQHSQFIFNMLTKCLISLQERFPDYHYVPSDKRQTADAQAVYSTESM